MSWKTLGVKHDTIHSHATLKNAFASEAHFLKKKKKSKFQIVSVTVCRRGGGRGARGRGEEGEWGWGREGDSNPSLSSSPSPSGPPRPRDWPASISDTLPPSQASSGGVYLLSGLQHPAVAALCHLVLTGMLRRPCFAAATRLSNSDTPKLLQGRCGIDLTLAR